MANNEKEVGIALAKAIAERNISDEIVKKAANKISQFPYDIKRIDICKYGICLNFWEQSPIVQNDLEQFVSNIDTASLGEFNIFEFGILNPDLFHIQSEISVDGIN